ncbi:hypothetical protein FA13DRAFT_131815, partial [Coprinellus micaceus]
QGKAVIRFVLSLNSSQPGASLTPLSAGHFPSFGYFPNEESYTGVCFEILNTSRTLRSSPSYAYSPVDSSFPPSPSTQALVEAGERCPVKLVPLIQTLPRVTCTFSGRVLCLSETDVPERESILCADYLA